MGKEECRWGPAATRLWTRQTQRGSPTNLGESKLKQAAEPCRAAA